MPQPVTTRAHYSYCPNWEKKIVIKMCNGSACITKKFFSNSSAYSAVGTYKGKTLEYNFAEDRVYHKYSKNGEDTSELIAICERTGYCAAVTVHCKVTKEGEKIFYL